MTTVILTIQWRRGTAAQWTAANSILASGEAGYETDTGKFKLGDGVTAWNALSYPPAGVSDHGALTGLLDDDHPQYLLAAEGAAAFDALGAAAAAQAAAIAAAAIDATTKANAAEADAIAASTRDRRFDSAGNFAYAGTAPVGSAENANAWSIRRMTFASGVYTVTQSATNVSWTGRAGHVYT